MIEVNDSINKLINYGLKKQLISEEDIYYSANRLISLLNVNSYMYTPIDDESEIHIILEELLDYAYQNQIINQNSVVFRDILDTEIMNCLMPRPSEVNETFWSLYKESSEEATNYFYSLSKASHYIRENRIRKNLVWVTNTKYGVFDITINLSKPEKDPIAIALAKTMPKSSYPLCLLCRENEGFKGHVNHPARGSHRLIHLKLNHEEWFFQYSPYVYYNEHCIVLKGSHEPMKMSRDTFNRLLEFVSLFPHYFIGSNADLPIVGGSILDHDHFQGGNYEFAMTKAKIKNGFTINKYPDVECGIVDWPMSVLRLRCVDRTTIVELADHILNVWRSYEDQSVGIIPFTKNEPHNTITPIARFRDELFELDLVLRNNRTDSNHPLGIFHPHNEHHHIKKENIGLIEVMGLAVLPARLLEEMHLVKQDLLNNNNVSENSEISKHALWIEAIKNKYPIINIENIDKIIEDEIGLTFMAILEQCGVFKNDEAGLSAFVRFINTINR